MRTYNKQNTTNVKQARKQSKELRKLKSNRNVSVITVDVVESKAQQQYNYTYEDDYSNTEGDLYV
jgi:hypothetical protein